MKAAKIEEFDMTEIDPLDIMYIQQVALWVPSFKNMVFETCYKWKYCSSKFCHWCILHVTNQFNIYYQVSNENILHTWTNKMISNNSGGLGMILFPLIPLSQQYGSITHLGTCGFNSNIEGFKWCISFPLWKNKYV